MPDPRPPAAGDAPLDPAAILGLRMLPPAPALAGLQRVRRILRSLQRRATLPPLAIFEGILGAFDHRVLGVLVDLGVPDHLDRPRSVEDLAERTGADADALARLLRYAATRGYVATARRGRFGPSAVSDLLRADHPSSWVPWVQRANSPWFWDALARLDEAVGVHRPPRADEGAAAANVVGSSVQAVALSRGLPWAGVRTLCDVGGGRGAVLEIILDAHPDLQGILLDREEVVAAAGPRLVSGALAARCRIEPGDFFAAVPEGCDRYLLMAITTLFDDHRVVDVLRTVRAAMAPTSRLFVVDSVLSDRPRDETAQSTDLLLLVAGAGRERTRAELCSLFGRAGLTTERTHRLLSGSTAFELRRVPDVAASGRRSART